MIEGDGARCGRAEAPGAQPGLWLSLALLCKPGIVAAISLSGFAGMALARGGFPGGLRAAFCVASLALVAGGAAVMNGVADRRRDLRMERLARRAAALEAVGPTRALAAALAMSGAGLLLAAAGLGPQAAGLLALAAVGYCGHYTLLLKRSSPWGALFGALPGALPVLIGAVAQRPVAGLDTLDDPHGRAAIALFAVMLVWQPPHFWLLSLALQDDYRAAGLPVLPLVKGERCARLCIRAGLFTLLPAVGLLAGNPLFSPAFPPLAAALAAGYLWAALRFMKGPGSLPAAFRASVAFLLALLLLVVADLSLG